MIQIGKRMMEKEKNLTFMLVVMCSLLAIVLCIGVTFARYSSEDEVVMTEMNIQPLILLGGSNSNTSAAFSYDEAGGQSMSFQVENDGTGAMQYKIVLAATLGFGNTALVTLTTDGDDYIGIPEALTEEDDLYFTMGEGYLYRFYDEDSEGERIFMIEADEKVDLNLNVKSAGAGMVQLQIVT